MLTDAAMSLDNVVALAAIARGDFWLLALGVFLSIPIVAYGGLILIRSFAARRRLLTFGAVVLGWVAGEMAVSDPLFAGWVKAQAPALSVIAPALGAALVWLAGEAAARDPPGPHSRLTRALRGSSDRLAVAGRFEIFAGRAGLAASRVLSSGRRIDQEGKP